MYERTDAALFGIIGTSHYSAHRYTLTRKSFLTQLGVAETVQAYTHSTSKRRCSLQQWTQGSGCVHSD